MSRLGSACWGRECCRHRQRDRKCCWGRRGNGQTEMCGEPALLERGVIGQLCWGMAKCPEKPWSLCQCSGPSASALVPHAAFVLRDKRLGTSSSTCEAERSRQSTSEQTAATFTCSQSTSIHPKYPPRSRATSVLSLSARGGHTCDYARLNNRENIQAG